MSIPMGGGYAPATGRVDFGWLGQAWTLLTAQLGTWIGATFLCGIVSLLAWMLVAIPTGVLAMMQQLYLAVSAGRTPPSTQSGSFLQFSEMHLLAVVVGGITAVLYGGLYRTALQQIRGEPISVLGVFSAFPQALSLLAVGVIVPLTTTIIEGTCQILLRQTALPAPTASSLSNLLSWLPSRIFEGLLMFAPLLILDRGASISESVLGSINLLKGQWVMGVLFYFVASLISGLGVLACGIGVLFTIPLFLISVAVGYQSLTQPPMPAEYPPYGAYPPQPGVWPPSPGVWPPPPGGNAQ